MVSQAARGPMCWRKGIPSWAWGMALLAAPACSWYTNFAVPPQVPVQSSIDPGLHWIDLDRVVILPFQGLDTHPRHAQELRKALVLALKERTGGRVSDLRREDLGRTAAESLRWNDSLPLNTLIRLHREFHADAALFGTVTYSRPYGDPALGLRLAMVDTRNGSTLWFADDVIDAEDPRVRNALESFCKADDSVGAIAEPSDVSLATFARFVARSFAASLPPPDWDLPKTRG